MRLAALYRVHDDEDHPLSGVAVQVPRLVEAEPFGVFFKGNHQAHSMSSRPIRCSSSPILFRLSGSESGMELMLANVYDRTFTDAERIPAYARAAVYWAVYNEVWCGTDSLDAGTTLAPREPATRAQIAVMITRYLEKFPAK